MPISELPDEFAVLLRRLTDAGFTLVEQRLDRESFGDALVVLRSGSTRIQFVRDRGQWFVEIGAPGADDWFGPVVWEAHFSGVMPPLELMPLQMQSRVILDRLDAIPDASAAPSVETYARLKALRRWHAAVRQGRTPSAPTDASPGDVDRSSGPISP